MCRQRPGCAPIRVHPRLIKMAPRCASHKALDSGCPTKCGREERLDLRTAVFCLHQTLPPATTAPSVAPKCAACWGHRCEPECKLGSHPLLRECAVEEPRFRAQPCQNSSQQGLGQLLEQFLGLRTGRSLNIFSSEDNPRLILPTVRHLSVLGILLSHDREQSTHEIIFFSVRANSAADRSPLV